MRSTAASCRRSVYAGRPWLPRTTQLLSPLDLQRVELRGLPRSASQTTIGFRRARLATTSTGAQQGAHADDVHSGPLTVGDTGDPHLAGRRAVRMSLKIRPQGLTNRLLRL